MSLTSHVQAGFTLVEVMVTVAVMSFGLLGLAALQSTGVRGNDNAYARSQAALLASDIVDRMRANRGAAQTTGAYDHVLGAAPPNAGDCTVNVCTPAQMASYDVSTWLATLAASLPGGDGSIACGPGNPVCTVVVQWRQGSGATNQITLTTQL